MTSTLLRDASATPRTQHPPPERRFLVGDRRAEWRGSRRDEDWVQHFDEESSDRRRTTETWAGSRS